MANLTETPTYDAGVYQLETADPVQGGAAGVSNAPLKNLANRTAYLKQRVDGIESGTTDLPGYAKIASPTFTGNPSAPTPALGDNDTSLPTTAFVQATVGGRLVKSVAGGSNVTLTAVEAGNGILEFTGALTANIAVIVPTSPTRAWIIKNATSGAYTLTVKTAAGTGVVCSQGYTAQAWTDGTNVYDALTDFDSPVLTGNPTAPTAAQFDDDTSLATTAFVRRMGKQYSTNPTVGRGSSLTSAHVGGMVILYDADNIGGTVTLPSAATLPGGATITVINGTGDGTYTVAAFGAQTINGLASLSIKSQTRIEFTVYGGRWIAYGHQSETPPQFDSSTKIATSEFVQRSLGNMQGSLDVTTTPYALSAADCGKLVNAYNSASSISLPDITLLPSGASFKIYTANALTIAAFGSQQMVPNPGYSGTVGSFSAVAGTVIELTARSSVWMIEVHGSGTALMSTSGYQRLPSGIIIQWGNASATPGGTAVSFPIAFPNAFYGCGVGIASVSSFPAFQNPTLSGFTFYCSTGTSSHYWIAIGR